jgi:hypothetical protein
MKSNYDIARTASEWWADIICKPVFNNGESDPERKRIMDFLTALSAKPINEEKKMEFKSVLAQVIKERLDCLKPKTTIVFSVDYNPDTVLGSIAETVGISKNNFPWKTCMWISSGHIAYRLGYQAPVKYLYITKDFLEDKINTSKELMSNYEKDDEYFDFLPPEVIAEEKAQAISGIQAQINEYLALMPIAED